MCVQIKRESCSSPISQCDEPTDLSTTGGREREERERERLEREREERERERQERERYYSQLMERYNIDRGSPSRCVPYLHLLGCFSIEFSFKTSLAFRLFFN
jgi:hypothetical protein